jgi:ATP-binding cassette subfamily B (MDR/TAP) protein 1
LLTLRTHLFLKEGVGRKLAESVQFFTTFCGAMGYAFYADWRTSLAVLAVAPFMILSILFLLKMNTSQTARANATYAKAGSIVSTAVSSIRTVLALNAVEKVIDLYQSATTEAYEGAASEVWLVGLANGSNMASFLLSNVVVTLLGSYFLYDNVRDTGCDPSGTVDGVPTCDPAGVDILGSLLAITFAAGVLPQVSVCVEAFIGTCVGGWHDCYVLEASLVDFAFSRC